MEAVKSGFKEYESKPITRRAYRIKPTDDIKHSGINTFKITIAGEEYTFKAYETIFPGDYVVYLDEKDIYHCRDAVFRERNIVDVE